LLGGSIRLFPTPDEVYLLTLRYYANATALSLNIKNSWLTYAPGLLVARAGLQVARFLRDPGGVALFAEDLKLAQALLAQRTVSREVASSDPRLGGFEFD
jgi:hypothetical protein